MSGSLTKAEIAVQVQKKLKIEYAQALDFVDQFFELIRAQLVQGDPVHYSGFGNFELRDKKSRPGLNPKTREPKIVKARRVVTFKSGQKLNKTILRAVAKSI